MTKHIRRLILVMALLAAAPSAAMADRPLGAVAAVVGEVHILRGDAALSAPVGAWLRDGDRLRTGPDGKVRVLFPDGSHLTLSPAAEVGVDEFAPEGDGEGVFALLRGALRLLLAPRPRGWDVDVRTATAIAAVRGTEFAVETDDGHTGVFVVSGTVQVSSRFGGPPRMLEAGEGVDVRAPNMPTVPVDWGEARVRALLARTGF